MLTLPDSAGPHRPVARTSVRRANSLRRTSSIDSTRPKGLGGDVAGDGRARDLLTGDAGDISATTIAHLTATIDLGRTLLSSTTEPPIAGLNEMVGTSVASGWRGRAAQALSIDTRHHPLLNLLIDDLPGASLVSQIALQAAHALPAASPGMRQHILAATDICAGWVSGGTMMAAFDEHDQMPSPVGPPAPVLEREDDALGWHPMAQLSAHATRRRRLLDLWADPDGTSTHAFEAHFRDSHVDADGQETVVHEYVVTGRLDEGTRCFTAVEAEARVLPWVECPNALASARRLVGTQIGDLRTRVRSDFTGVSTCTHLNDTLRSLADIEPWLDLATGMEPRNERDDG